MIKNLKLLIRKFVKKRMSLVELPAYQIDLDHALISSVNLVTSFDTLNDIKTTILSKKKGAYQRFGDGDIYLLRGKDDLLQTSNPELSLEMNEAFLLNKGIVHKALPINSHQYGFEEGMVYGNHLIEDKMAFNYLKSVYPYFVGRKIYSTVALHYIATINLNRCIDYLKFIKLQDPIFVGNENLPDNLIKNLFSENIVWTPSSNAYENIDLIEQNLQSLLHQQNEFKLVIVAMGCSGRVLQKRILNKNFNCYLFDFGSLLDALAGFETREWMKHLDNVNIEKIKDAFEI